MRCLKSLARPGGNLTGPVASLKLIDKRLELLKEIDPKVHSVLVLFDGHDPYSPRERTLARQAAEVLHLKLVERDVRTEAELRQFFAGLKPGDVGAVIVGSPDFQTNHPRVDRDRLSGSYMAPVRVVRALSHF
jgi:putative tryptophan/tyrosine transport system substrate-binding protein